MIINNAAILWRRVTKKQLLINVKKVSKILLLFVLIGYFLSQSGFVNFVAGAVPLSFSLDYYRVSTSPDKNIQRDFNAIYIPEQDVFSATWLSNYKIKTAEVLADRISGVHVLVSYGLIPDNLILPITNETTPMAGNCIYLSRLNTQVGIISTTTESFNTSQILPILNCTDLIYTNGNSQIRYVPKF